jgi:broad specificity phosphatase PhoE
MPYLYLIRHPNTRPDPSTPASLWRLSDEGHAQVRRLLEAPFWQSVSAIYTSTEYKTIVVGEAIHAALEIPTHPMIDLGEAKRDTWLDGQEFLAVQNRFFVQPDQPPVPEWESAQSAQTRFVSAMERVLANAGSLVVVSHATVLTLYIAHLRHMLPSVAVWQTLGFMEVMAVDRATMQPVTEFLAAPYDGLPYEDRDSLRHP